MEILTPIEIGAGRLDGGGGWRNTEGSEASAMTQLAGPLKDWSAFYFLHRGLPQLSFGLSSRLAAGANLAVFRVPSPALNGKPVRQVGCQDEATAPEWHPESWYGQALQFKRLFQR
jgi:hypothetical protein